MKQVLTATKEADRGTRLGLSTTYGFIRQSGGDLMIESEVGRGTMAKIYLPRDESGESAEEPEYEAARQVPRAQGDEVVLAVEDDHHVRATTAAPTAPTAARSWNASTSMNSRGSYALPSAAAW